MEINLTSETLKKWGAIILIILVLVGGIYYLSASGVLDKLFGKSPLPEENIESLGALVAVLGVEAVFTLDYEEPASVWLERICAISTESGCQVTESFLMKSIESILTTKEPRTTCSAEYVGRVDFGEESDGVGEEEEIIYQWEVWEVNLSLDNPWKGAKAEDTLFVQVSNEEGEWKFNRILFDQEAKKFSEEVAQ